MNKRIIRLIALQFAFCIGVTVVILLDRYTSGNQISIPSAVTRYIAAMVIGLFVDVYNSFCFKLVRFDASLDTFLQLKTNRTAELIKRSIALLKMLLFFGVLIGVEMGTVTIPITEFIVCIPNNNTLSHIIFVFKVWLTVGLAGGILLYLVLVALKISLTKANARKPPQDNRKEDCCV